MLQSEHGDLSEVGELLGGDPPTTTVGAFAPMKVCFLTSFEDMNVTDLTTVSDTQDEDGVGSFSAPVKVNTPTIIQFVNVTDHTAVDNTNAVSSARLQPKYAPKKVISSPLSKM